MKNCDQTNNCDHPLVPSRVPLEEDIRLQILLLLRSYHRLRNQASST